MAPGIVSPDPPRSKQGGGTIDRWSLTVDQRSAIEAYLWAKRMTSVEARVIASYCPNAAIRTTGGEIETRADQRLAAKRTMNVIDGVFVAKKDDYRSLFDNVVLHGARAADAGAYLTTSPSGAEAAAKWNIAQIADDIFVALQRDRRTGG